MSIDYYKWLREQLEDKANFFVLVGPAAVGKSTWVKENFEDLGKKFIVINRDDIIVQLYKQAKKEGGIPLSNKHLYTSPQSDDTHPIYGKVINYTLPTSPDKIRKAYEVIYKTNELINQKIQEKINTAISSKIDIIIDGLNSDSIERKKVLDLISNNNYKKIAVFFPFAGHTEEIKKSAEMRAKILAAELGPDFDRSISDEQYEKMFSKITKPTTAEGFDEVIEAGRFKDKKMDVKITTENLVRNFREWSEVLEEASVSQLVHKYDIPKEFAKHVKTSCSNKNADTILKIFIGNYKGMISELTSEVAKDKKKLLIDNYITEFNRYMKFVGKTTDNYLKKHSSKKSKEELVELCKKSWTGYLKKMRDFKKSLEENLNEAKMSKYWRRKAKERARRHEREYPNKIDKKWAQAQQKKWNKEPDLEEEYLKEIESAMESSRATKTYLETIKKLRQEKRKLKQGMVHPNEKPKQKLPPRPTADKRKPNQKIRGPYHVGDIATSGNVSGGGVSTIGEEQENE